MLMQSLPKIIAGVSKPVFMGFVIALVAVLCVVDYFFEPRVSMLLFYLAPILLATWYIGPKSGITISSLCALGWGISDVASTGAYSHPIIPYWNVCINLGIFLIVSITLSKLKSALHGARESARTDALTGIANRRAFFEIAGSELSRMNRYKRPFTIAYLDLDDFKLVNDNFGHEAGDDLLRCITGFIESTIRSSDLIARLGGDEFAILLPETNEEQARAVMEKINLSLHETLVKYSPAVTFSIGVVTYVRPPANVDDMLKKADHMMYAAKREGKNAVKYLVWKDTSTAQ
jgi:diguanylate cyclase (GGDEF)-like protein